MPDAWRADPLAFLDRGQGWVAREVSEALPRVPWSHPREALQEMLDRHRGDIASCKAPIAELG